MQKLNSKLPQLHKLFTDNKINIQINIVSWIITLFTRLFKLDSILIIWDILFVNKMSLYILE